VRDSSDDSADNVAIAVPCLGIIRRAEAERIHDSERTRAHREDVAENAAHTCRRALKRLDEARMVVRLDLECRGVAVPDIDDTRVLSRPHEDAVAGSRQLLQVLPRAFVGAVLAPHHADDAELGEIRIAADLRDDSVVFLLRQSVLFDDVGGDGRHAVSGSG